MSEQISKIEAYKRLRRDKGTKDLEIKGEKAEILEETEKDNIKGVEGSKKIAEIYAGRKSDKYRNEDMRKKFNFDPKKRERVHKAIKQKEETDKELRPATPPITAAQSPFGVPGDEEAADDYEIKKAA